MLAKGGMKDIEQHDKNTMELYRVIRLYEMKRDIARGFSSLQTDYTMSSRHYRNHITFFRYIYEVMFCARMVHEIKTCVTIMDSHDHLYAEMTCHISGDRIFSCLEGKESTADLYSDVILTNIKLNNRIGSNILYPEKFMMFHHLPWNSALYCHLLSQHIQVELYLLQKR
jgi:hypothetical protein